MKGNTMRKYPLLGAVTALVLAAAGCASPSSFDGYVHAECDATVNNVTVCRSTQKPVPTVTQTVPGPTVTVTPTPTPTATATPTPTPTPTATQAAGPTNLRLDPAVAVTTTSFRVLWDAVAGVPATGGYNVYKNDVKVGTSSDTGESFSGLTAGTTYKIGVSGVVNGVETQITSANFTTAAASPSPTPTPTPTPTTTTSPPTATTPNAPFTGTLVFQDEFDGTALDTTRWHPTWFNGGTMNGVSTSASNVTVRNGAVELKLSSGTVGSLIDTDRNQGVANGFEMTTGYVEARIYFPGPDSTHIYNWPAWWTDGHSWPADGEIDIAEPAGWSGANHTMTSNYHYSLNGAHASKSAGTIPGNWANSWHTYGVLKKADGTNEHYYDGVKVWSYTRGENSPQYLILNMGYQGGSQMLGDAGAMKVDYVRAWK